MTVSYYLHTPLPDESNEWPAVSRLCRKMERHFGKSPDPYTLIFNVDPKERIITAEGRKLTQLDALLFGPKLTAVLELKHCFEPIRADEITAPWFAGDNEFQLKAGSSKTPYFQVRNARKVWSSYLAEKFAFRFPSFSLKEWQKRWEHLSVFLLLAPYLHPDSSLPPLQKAGGWLTIGSIGDVADFVHRTRTDRFDLSLNMVNTLVTDILGAEPWPKLQSVLDEQIGDLFLAEPNRPLIRIPLYQFDEISIGRSNSQLVRIYREFGRISKAHAHLEVHNGQVELFDSGSKNGTFVKVNGRFQQVTPGYKLAPQERVLLGSKNSKHAVQLWYKLHTHEVIYTADTKTIFGTLDTEDR